MSDRSGVGGATAFARGMEGELVVGEEIPDGRDGVVLGAGAGDLMSPIAGAEDPRSRGCAVGITTVGPALPPLDLGSEGLDEFNGFFSDGGGDDDVPGIAPLVCKLTGGVAGYVPDVVSDTGTGVEFERINPGGGSSAGGRAISLEGDGGETRPPPRPNPVNGGGANPGVLSGGGGEKAEFAPVVAPGIETTAPGMVGIGTGCGSTGPRGEVCAGTTSFRESLFTPPMSGIKGGADGGVMGLAGLSSSERRFSSSALRSFSNRSFSTRCRSISSCLRRSASMRCRSASALCRSCSSNFKRSASWRARSAISSFALSIPSRFVRRSFSKA